MRLNLELAMCILPAVGDGGDYREHEIDERETPEPAPIARDLPEARAHLIEANNAVDRKIGGKDIGGGLHKLRNGFARPRIAGEEEQRQACAKKNERRCLRMLEPGTYRLAQETGCQNKHRGEGDEVQRMTERRKAVDARQDK